MGIIDIMDEMSSRGRLLLAGEIDFVVIVVFVVVIGRNGHRI